MILSNYSQYINNIAQSPNDYYKDLAQETINSQWDCTTQLRTIQEENLSKLQDWLLPEQLSLPGSPWGLTPSGRPTATR